VQTIRPALEGKSLVVTATTGTGKTAAYLLPILDAIARRKRRTTSALILVPTKELAEQTRKVAKQLGAHLGQLNVLNLAGRQTDVVQRAQLADAPDIVVGTPANCLSRINDGSLSTKYLAHLVVDEADLVMGYDFQEDLMAIAQTIPKGIQSFLTSATLNAGIDTVQDLFCHDPVMVKLDAPDKTDQVKQYVLRCTEPDKFLLLYAMFK
jgi:ATP-dependent RNA helicase DDX56/DBP9